MDPQPHERLLAYMLAVRGEDQRRHRERDNLPARQAGRCPAWSTRSPPVPSRLTRYEDARAPDRCDKKRRRSFAQSRTARSAARAATRRKLIKLMGSSSVTKCVNEVRRHHLEDDAAQYADEKRRGTLGAHRVPPDPHEIYDELSQYVMGRGRQARHERRRLQPLPPHHLGDDGTNADGERVERLAKSNILLGPTGTGKTLLAQTLCALPGEVPLPSRTPRPSPRRGYVGEDVEASCSKPSPRPTATSGEPRWASSTSADP